MTDQRMNVGLIHDVPDVLNRHGYTRTSRSSVQPQQPDREPG